LCHVQREGEQSSTGEVLKVSRNRLSAVIQADFCESNMTGQLGKFSQTAESIG
jgi:hypothetical protein